MLLPELLLMVAMSASFSDDEARDLAARIRDGDARAFRHFFEQHHAALLRFLKARSVRQEVAEDLIQQAFLTLWEKRADIDTSRSLRAFLFTVAYNRMLNHQRDLRREVTETALPETPHAGQSPEEEAITADAMRMMRTRLETMPEKRRAVFELIYLQELSHREAAEILEVSTKTIENHMTIALKELREALKEFMK